MHVEVSVALNFVISYLYNKLPRRRVDMFGEEVEKGLKKKFDGHWYADQPFKGSGFRCIRISHEKMDYVLTNAAHASGLDIEEVREYLPKEMTVWIDPHEVSYRLGEKGTAKILYSDRKDEDGFESNITSMADKEVQIVSRGFNPEAQSFRPIDTLSSPQSNVSLSPSPNGWIQSTSTSPSHQASPSVQSNAFQSTSPVNSFVGRIPKTATFTAATFAQTKFGSTKLKTQAKRPSRLSPTEMGAFMKQRTPVSPWSGSPIGLPNGLSPTGMLPHGHPSPHSPASMELLEYQQRMMMMQQQQQQLSPMHSGSGLPSPATATTPLGMGDLYLQTNVSGVQNNDLLSPLSGGIPNVPGIPGPVSMPVRDHNGLQQQQQQQQMTTETSQGTPSPTESGSGLVDSLGSWNSPKMPPYNSLQHLLVAN